MTTARPKRVPLKRLTRQADTLHTSLNEALDALAVASRRERAMREGESADRAQMESRYPALEGRR